MSFKWKRETVEKLITCVQQYSCLYNVKSNEYLDRLKKAQALHNISQDLCENESTIAVDEVKRKWRVLRNQFMREQRLLKTSKKSGAGVNDIYTPKLWCFEQLSFLQTHIEMRGSIDNTELENEENIIPDSGTTSVSEIHCSNGENSLIEAQPKKKKKDGIIDFKNDLTELKNTIANKKRKKFAWLGNLVAEKMEDVDPEDLDDAAWVVQCLMRRLTKSATTQVHYLLRTSYSYRWKACLMIKTCTHFVYMYIAL